MDLRRKSNFLIVDQSAPGAARARRERRVGAAAEATVLRAETSARAIEEAFKEFTNRDDIAVVLINQYVRAARAAPRRAPRAAR